MKYSYALQKGIEKKTIELKRISLKNYLVKKTTKICTKSIKPSKYQFTSESNPLTLDSKPRPRAVKVETGDLIKLKIL